MSNDILICVITSSTNEDRINTINKTWNHRNSINTIFVSDQDDLENNILKFSDSSDYKSAEDKTVNILSYIKLNNRNKWYFIVDDDTFVNTKNLTKFVEVADPNFVYGYMAHKDWWNGLEYTQGGAGTLISQEVINKINYNTIRNYDTGYGDVSLGLIFNVNNIQIKGCNQSEDCLFLEKSFNHYKYIGKEKLSEKITFHQVRTYDDMKEIIDFYGA
jgi:hypothetical protein